MRLTERLSLSLALCNFVLDLCGFGQDCILSSAKESPYFALRGIRDELLHQCTSCEEFGASALMGS